MNSTNLVKLLLRLKVVRWFAVHVTPILVIIIFIIISSFYEQNFQTWEILHVFVKPTVVFWHMCSLKAVVFRPTTVVSWCKASVFE